jgi:hypothetical protein
MQMVGLPAFSDMADPTYDPLVELQQSFPVEAQALLFPYTLSLTKLSPSIHNISAFGNLYPSRHEGPYHTAHFSNTKIRTPSG